jgi:choline-sulfatase
MSPFRFAFWTSLSCLLCWGEGLRGSEPSIDRPNVLMIAIDDQNDWIGCMGGNPLADTPNIDRLAARGTLFLNAHCQSPLCNPSRTSVMTGLRPSTTGIYGLEPWLRSVKSLAEHVTMPQAFQRAGYQTYVTGKIFHGNAGGEPKRREEFQHWGPGSAIGRTPPSKLIGPTPMGNHPLMDWGAFDHRDEEKGDWAITTWAIEQLQQMPSDAPFFLSVGYFLPHVPCYVTPEDYNHFPDDTRLLPELLESDREDTPRYSWYLHWSLPEPRWKWVVEKGEDRNLCRSYLASTRFIDRQIGRLLDALQASPWGENTLVVLWSDHGFHLGEKGVTGKNTLWEPSTRVPLILAGPGVASGARCLQPVELLDLYPTLAERCHLEAPDNLEGHSLVPQLQDAGHYRPWPAITTHNSNNHSIRDERWRWIVYADGSQELYDLKEDPNEWRNRIDDPAASPQATRLAEWLPKVNLPPVSGSHSRVLTYDPQKDEVTWEGMTVRRGDAIPE